MIDKFLTIVPPWLIMMLVIFGVLLGAAAYLILLERKIAAWTQDRIGPNRAGPRGLLQPMADGLKMFTKQEFRAPDTDKHLFNFAPILMMIVVFTAMAVIPWGGIYQGSVTHDAGDTVVHVPSGGWMVGQPVPTGNANEVTTTYRVPFQVLDVNIGVLFVIAILALAVYAAVLGGWAGNNKYSFLGGMRAAAQIISYEVPLGLSIIAIVLMFGTLSLNEITTAQAHYWFGFIPAWNILCQPIACVLFLICLHAEANRAPFDLAEAEQELVGGYHTEYSSMRLGLLLMGEYIEMTITSAVLVALFLGGWHFPGLTGNVDPANPSVTSSILEIILRIVVYLAKVGLVVSVFMWVRWTLPRLRYDQLMGIAWRAFVPISLAVMMGTAVVVYFWDRQPSEAAMLVSGPQALALLALNIALVLLFAVAYKLKPASTARLNARIALPPSRFRPESQAIAPRPE